jgi:hypothetical protein
MMWRRRLLVALLTLVMLGLGAVSMGLILLHMRPITPDRIEIPNIE